MHDYCREYIEQLDPFRNRQDFHDIVLIFSRFQKPLNLPSVGLMPHYLRERMLVLLERGIFYQVQDVHFECSADYYTVIETLEKRFGVGEREFLDFAIAGLRLPDHPRYRNRYARTVIPWLREIHDDVAKIQLIRRICSADLKLVEGSLVSKAVAGISWEFAGLGNILLNCDRYDGFNVYTLCATGQQIPLGQEEPCIVVIIEQDGRFVLWTPTEGTIYTNDPTFAIELTMRY